MENQLQNPEIRINPEKFHPWIGTIISHGGSNATGAFGIISDSLIHMHK